MKIIIKDKGISYKKLGNGKKNVLLVHGWSGKKESLEGLAKQLSSNYTCYLIDLLGRGESDLPEKDWGIEEYAEIVQEFIKEVIGDDTYYIGHSFGGSLGVYIASKTELISRLVLCAPSFKRTAQPQDSKEQTNTVSMIKQLLTPFRRIYYRIFYPNSENFKLPKLESNFRKVITQDLTKNLKNIITPTLIVWGADDIETPLNDAYILNEGIENSKLVIKGSYGHELPVYYPEVIADEINSFLKAK